MERRRRPPLPADEPENHLISEKAPIATSIERARAPLGMVVADQVLNHLQW